MQKACQSSLARRVQCEGRGVHSGAQTRLTLVPAPPDTGILFLRSDARDRAPREREIPAHFRNVSSTLLSTEIQNAHGVGVRTVEHLMAALWGLGVDNLQILVEGSELPIMDGSAEPFVEACEEAGQKSFSEPRSVLRILSPISVEEEGRFAKLSPLEEGDQKGGGKRDEDGFYLDVAIDFSDPAIGRQRFSGMLSPESFARDIAPARTFGFMEDLEGLRKAGMAQGASLENTIAIEKGKILNDGGLRFPDECVRHKALDVIGDLALAGHHIAGKFSSLKSGHALNHKLLQKLFDSPDAWRLEKHESHPAL